MTLRCAPVSGKGRCVVEARDELAVDRVADADRLLLDRALAEDERELHPQQLVEDEPAASAALRVHRFGCVDRPERLLPTLQVQPLQHRVGHRIGDPPWAAPRERGLDPARDLPRREARLLGLRVHGHDPAGAVADEVDHRVGHGEPAAVRLGPPEERNLQAGVELSLPPRLVEEHEPEPPRLVARLDRDHLLAGASRRLVRRSDRDEDERLLTVAQVPDAGFVRAVDPTARVVGEKVEHGRHAELFEPVCLLGADPLQRGDRDRVQIAQREGRWVRGHRCAGA